MPSPHTRASALIILSVWCARAAVADHARRPASVAALIYYVAYLSGTNKINKLALRSAVTATATEASDLRFRPTLSTTDSDRRVRLHTSENPANTNEQTNKQAICHVLCAICDMRHACETRATATGGLSQACRGRLRVRYRQ